MTTKQAKKKSGSGKRYKFDCLFECIQKVMPVCSSEWDKVAEIYQKASEEVKIRDGADLKRTFFTNKNMCNKHKVPTGTSDDAPFVKKCIELAKHLGDKEHGAIEGGSDSDEEKEDDDDEEDKVDEHQTSNRDVSV